MDDMSYHIVEAAFTIPSYVLREGKLIPFCMRSDSYHLYNCARDCIHPDLDLMNAAFLYETVVNEGFVFL